MTARNETVTAPGRPELLPAANLYQLPAEPLRLSDVPAGATLRRGVLVFKSAGRKFRPLLNVEIYCPRCGALHLHGWLFGWEGDDVVSFQTAACRRGFKLPYWVALERSPAAAARNAAVLAEEPQALAITLDALAQAYDWVVCRLGTPQARTARDILAVAGSQMDTAIIASDRDPEDADLLDLYALAEASGAGQILVAQDQAAAALALEAPAFAEDAMPLRLSAA